MTEPKGYIKLSKLSLLITLAVVFSAGFAIGSFSSTTSLIKKESNPAIEIVKAYLSSQSLDDRLRLVRHPELTEKLMKSHYEGVDINKPVDFDKIEIVKKSHDFGPGKGWVGVAVKLSNEALVHPKIKREKAFFVVNTNHGMKIDWEASTTYNPLSFKALKVEQPLDPIKMRVIAELSDYYNFDFLKSQGTHFAIKLKEPQTYEYVDAYINRDSDDGKALYSKLKDGEAHPVIVKIKYLKNSESSNNVLITDYIKPGFLE
jgi:hypothetical protein